MDEVKTSLAPGSASSMAATTLRVPSTFTRKVTSRSLSLLGGRRAARWEHGSCAVDGVPYAGGVRHVAARYLDALSVLQAGEVHGGQVEDSHGAARPGEHLDQLPADVARPPGDEHRGAHVRVVPFMPAFSMTSWALAMSLVRAGPKPSQSA